MSFDVLIVKRIENTDDVRYEIGSNCAPTSPLCKCGDVISADESFNHIDGVTIFEEEGDCAWIYNVEHDCLGLIDMEFGVIFDWVDPDEQDQAYEPFIKLRKLFRDHWPTLGEIADATRSFVCWKE